MNYDSAFLAALNDSTVTYIRDMAAYGWEDGGEGWEAISPYGEIRSFHSRDAANEWRMHEVREYAEYLARKH